MDDLLVVGSSEVPQAEAVIAARSQNSVQRPVESDILDRDLGGSNHSLPVPYLGNAMSEMLLVWQVERMAMSNVSVST